MNQLVNDKLVETRNNLVQEISILNNIQFNSKPDMDIWSIAQVCHHLVLVEKSAIKAIAWGLKQSDLTRKERKKLDHILLDRTEKIQAPIIVEPDKTPFEVQQIIDMLNDSREKLITFLSEMENTSVLSGKSVKHLVLGELPLDQWIEMIYLHEQRHIEQIKEIKLLLEVKH